VKNTINAAKFVFSFNMNDEKQFEQVLGLKKELEAISSETSTELFVDVQMKNENNEDMKIHIYPFNLNSEIPTSLEVFNFHKKYLEVFIAKEENGENIVLHVME